MSRAYRGISSECETNCGPRSKDIYETQSSLAKRSVQLCLQYAAEDVPIDLRKLFPKKIPAEKMREERERCEIMQETDFETF